MWLWSDALHALVFGKAYNGKTKDFHKTRTIKWFYMA